MHRIFLFQILLTFGASSALAADDFVGAWDGTDGQGRLDVLDGFAPNRGPVIFTEPDGSAVSGRWERDDGVVSVSYGYNSFTVVSASESALVLEEWSSKEAFERISEKGGPSPMLTLRESRDAFIAKLIENDWITTLNGGSADFKTTFSNDVGVVVFADPEGDDGLRPWAIAGDSLKIGGTTFVSSMVNDKYFIGLDDNDNLMAFRFAGKSASDRYAEIGRQREKFFDEMLTGRWFRHSVYSSPVEYAFLPVYGELHGQRISLKNGLLSGNHEWEYSPSTGALRIGRTVYANALIVDDTLALLEDDGEQTFLKNFSDINAERVTLSDVTSTPLDENNLAKIQKTLSLQFATASEYEPTWSYTLEFSDDGRNGFIHQWRSRPFNITGATLETDIFEDSRTLHRIQDFVVFDDHTVWQMDNGPSRLRIKSEDEVSADAEALSLRTDALMEKSLVMRIATTSGETIDVPLPVETFSDIGSMQLIVE